MKRHIQNPSGGTTIVGVLGIKSGGTGGSTSKLAAESMGCFTTEHYNVPGGIAQYDENGLLLDSVLPDLPLNMPTLKGSRTVVTNNEAKFKITNYDSSITYNIAVTAGTVQRLDDFVIYTAGAVEGNVTLTVNNATVAITVVPAKPNAPTILTPVNNSTNISDAYVFTASAFSIPSLEDTHYASDWQLSTVSNFSTTVNSTSMDKVNKTSWDINNVSVSTTYYLRVRYFGTVYGYGDWSPTVTFITKAVFYPTSEIATFTSPNKMTSGQFTIWVKMTADGTRLLVGAHNETVTGSLGAGRAYIFVKTGSVWSQEAVLSASDKAAYAYFGLAGDISSDGTMVAIGCPYLTVGANDYVGKVYVFTRSGSTWTQQYTMLASEVIARNGFGYSIAISQDKSRMAIGATRSASNTYRPGKVYIYRDNGGSWVEEQVISPGISNNSGVGEAIAMTPDGTRIIIGARNEYIYVNGTTYGVIYIYVRTGTTWALEFSTPGVVASHARTMGFSVAINDAGTKVVAGTQWFSNTHGNQGCIIVYKRTGSTWTTEAKIYETPPTSEAYFGYCVRMAASGNKIVVSSTGSTVSGKGNSGKIHIYRFNGTSWVLMSTINATDTEVNSYFGHKMGHDAEFNTLAVGTFQDAGGFADSGKVYILA
jgi:hypothetical protein